MWSNGINVHQTATLEQIRITYVRLRIPMRSLLVVLEEDSRIDNESAKYIMQGKRLAESSVQSACL